jgi:hypothetical protein
MQIFDHNIGFWEKTPIFFAENCQKSQKIVIITSTPDHPDEWLDYYTNAAHVLTLGQGCQIFLGPNIPNWEKYSKWTQTIPNGHKLYQMALKYS